MKLLKKMFIFFILIVMLCSYQSKIFAITQTFITNTKDETVLRENINEKIKPEFGTTFDKSVGMNGFIDDPIEVLSAVGTVREYHNFSWTMDKLNENKFNPSYVSVWNFDEYYKKLYEAGVDIMPCIQGTSKCVVPNLTSRNQKPITDGEDANNPASYSEHASTMFQYAARYGNEKVDDSKLLLASDQEKVSGLGYIKYYENWNEPDKTWEGDKSYFSPEALAAMCSADYDGHEGRLGDTYGIKNADENAKLVMGGVCNSANLTNYLTAMKEWAENNRTDKVLPFDVINFHMYVGKQCPENSNFQERCEEIVNWRNENAIDKEVWLTEFGWDTNSNSQLSAPSKQAQRDWLIRSYLIAYATGVERSTMYMVRDTGGENQTGKYATCGLTTQKGEWNKKPSWYGVYTLKNTLEGFKFKEIVKQEDDIYIYKFYKENTDEECYVLWCPTQNESKIDNYSLNINNKSSAQLTVLEDNSITGKQTNLEITNNTVQVNVSETPIFVKTSGTKQEDDETIAKTLYTIESVENMSLAGTNRGNWHDRQNLGIYMKAGASFKIRQTNSKLNKDLTLDCLNNDSETEKTYTIPKNGEWVTISVDSESVPFIRTVYGTKEQPQIEIKELQETEELTYYYYKDNEQEFFNKWNENNHQYAVIENDRATFLVPLKNKDNIIQNTKYGFKSIDEMLEYYSEFIEQYDRYIGLAYTTDNPLNKNVKTKFFIKANIHGAGAAYYGGNHTAQNGDNIGGYLTRGWLNLHELGHGYEGSLARQDLELVEVMNNILAHYYQITYLDENDGGWLGKKINIEGNMKTARESIAHYNEFNYQQKLYVFVNLLDKIGSEKSMANLHSEYRETLSKGIQYNASDLLAKAFSEASEYNVIPYLISNKITPSEEIQEQIYENDLPMVYYLRDFVQTDEKAEKIRKELNLEGIYSVVANTDIAKYKMLGNLSIEISIDDLEEINGKKLYIKDGNKIIKEVTIENKNIKISDLPVGIYTIQMPNTKQEAYKYSYEYVVIKEGTETQKNIKYEKIKINPLASDTQILFRGLGDSQFATAELDLAKKELRIISANAQPHVYFEDEYANIQVLDIAGNLVYEKSYTGNRATPANDVIPIELGYTIKIKHRESEGRLILKSKILNKKEEYIGVSNEITYKITEYGMQEVNSTETEQYENYIKKVDQYAIKLQNEIQEEKQKNKYSYFIQKNNLLSCILKLNDEDKENYLTKYKTLLNGSAPIIEDIQTLKFTIGDELQIPFTNFKATDLEDGVIFLNEENTKISFNIPTENNKVSKEGSYIVKVTVSDLDKNETTEEFTVVVDKKVVDNSNKDENQPTDEENQNEEKKTEENKPNDIKKPIENKPSNNTNKQQNNQTNIGGRLPQTGSKPNTILVVGIIMATIVAIGMYIKFKMIK